MIYLDGDRFDIKHYPDNTLLLKLPYTRNSARIQWRYESSEEMVAILFLTKALQTRGGVELDMPYIPNARMDRVKHPEDVFTLKYFCEFINSLGFTKVTVLDPHSGVSEALLNNLVVDTEKLHGSLVLTMRKCDPDYVFFPDEGAAKRYSESADRPYFFANKKREWQTGKITGLELCMNGVPNPLCGKSVLIIDDICSKGGTFFHAAKALKAAGAGDIYLYVTHCENSIHDGELINSGLLKRIYTTPSILTKPHDLIEVLKTEESLFLRDARHVSDGLL